MWKAGVYYGAMKLWLLVFRRGWWSWSCAEWVVGITTRTKRKTGMRNIHSKQRMCLAPYRSEPISWYWIVWNSLFFIEPCTATSWMTDNDCDQHAYNLSCDTNIIPRKYNNRAMCATHQKFKKLDWNGPRKKLRITSFTETRDPLSFENDQIFREFWIGRSWIYLSLTKLVRRQTFDDRWCSRSTRDYL